MKRKTIFLNIHFWLVVLNAISVFLILQIVFGVFPCRECDWPSDKIERVNSLVSRLSSGERVKSQVLSFITCWCIWGSGSVVKVFVG